MTTRTQANTISIIHNECLFTIERYFANQAVIKIKPLGGVLTSGETDIFVTELISNLTTNFGGGFVEWVKDNY